MAIYDQHNTSGYSGSADFNRPFAQTREQRIAAKQAKKTWKYNMIMFHGSAWRKHNNYPFKLKD